MLSGLLWHFHDRLQAVLRHPWVLASARNQLKPTISRMHVTLRANLTLACFRSCLEGILRSAERSRSWLPPSPGRNLLASAALDSEGASPSVRQLQQMLPTTEIEASASREHRSMPEKAMTRCRVFPLPAKKSSKKRSASSLCMSMPNSK